jgi:hypothetical protein
VANECHLHSKQVLRGQYTVSPDITRDSDEDQLQFSFKNIYLCIYDHIYICVYIYALDLSSTYVQLPFFLDSGMITLQLVRFFLFNRYIEPVVTSQLIAYFMLIAFKVGCFLGRHFNLISNMSSCWIDNLREGFQ